MRDHEFEEHVHRKMEDLHLDPSPDVWVHVKDRLYQKRRRRRMLWLPFLFTAVLLCSCLLVSDYYSARHPAASLQHTFTRSSIREKSLEKKTSGNNLLKSEHSARISIAAHSSTRHQQTMRLRLHQTNPEQSPALSSLNHLPVTDRETGTAEKASSMLSAMLLQEDTESIKEPVAAQVSDIIEINGDYLKKITLQPGIDVVNLIKLKKKGWEWGFSLQLTRATFRSGSLNKLFGNYSAADFQLNGPNLLGGVIRRIPVAGERGIVFSGGMYMKKHLGRRVDFFTGLQYALLTTRLADDSVKQRNNYHFIELPATFQWKMSNGRQPLTAEAGVSFSRLLAGNAVHYNSTLNGYYKDDHTSNRTQVSIRTGVYIMALPRSPHPLLLGPTLQYGLTSILTDTENRSSHIFQYGLRLSTMIK